MYEQNLHYVLATKIGKAPAESYIHQVHETYLG